MHRLTILFAYTLLLFFLLPLQWPNLHLLYFAPFLAIAIYKTTRVNALWLAFFCGIIVDLLSAQTRLGMHALNYCITIFILYGQRKNFFEDRYSTFPTMTFLFAFISTLIQVGLLNLFGHGVILSWAFVKSDLFWMPLRDALYAAIAYTLPLSFCKPPQKRQTSLFSLKEYR